MCHPLRHLSAYFVTIAFGLPLTHISALEIVQAEAVMEQAANINQQLRAQYEPAVKVEVSFAIRACQLEGEQRRKFVSGCEQWLDNFVQDGNKQQPPNRNGVVIFRARLANPGNANNDPRESIRKGVASVCKKELTAEQFAAYERECERRELFFREAIASILISRMDEKLALSEEQRGKLLDSFIEKWDAQWAPPLEMFLYNNEYWPSIPDKVVSPHLTPAQWEIWTRLTKNAPQVHFGVNLGDRNQVIDDVEFEKKVEAPPQAEGVFLDVLQIQQ